MIKLPMDKNQIKIINHEDYNYILQWSKVHLGVHEAYGINDLKTFFDFIFRLQTEGEIQKFGEEPLKIAWNSLMDFERVVLSNELAAIYMNHWIEFVIPQNPHVLIKDT